MRTVCVWYPDWPLPEGDLGRPVFVFEDRPRGPGGETQRVRAANQAAVAAGIQLGMGRRAAEALCPMAQAIPRDLGAETRRFEQVVQTLENLIPRVEVMEPGLAMLPTVGALRYYGGEHELVTTIARELNKVATGARLGVADGPFAARWAAMTAGEGPRIIVDTVAFLADLDVSVLERDELIATFRWLGITTLGDLAVLPRPAVASRFGEAGLDAHRLASGEDRQPQPRPVPAHLAVESHFDDALESLDQVAFAARALSARLMIGLRREGIAPHRVEIEAQAANGVVRARTWRSTDPFIEA
ncbi:MAG TPA: DNA polymerase Y family protein, partial [Acidimicrobiia bacterium]